MFHPRTLPRSAQSKSSEPWTSTEMESFVKMSLLLGVYRLYMVDVTGYGVNPSLTLFLSNKKERKNRNKENIAG